MDIPHLLLLSTLLAWLGAGCDGTEQAGPPDGAGGSERPSADDADPLLPATWDELSGCTFWLRMTAWRVAGTATWMEGQTSGYKVALGTPPETLTLMLSDRKLATSVAYERLNERERRYEFEDHSDAARDIVGEDGLLTVTLALQDGVVSAVVRQLSREGTDLEILLEVTLVEACPVP